MNYEVNKALVVSGWNNFICFVLFLAFKSEFLGHKQAQNPCPLEQPNKNIGSNMTGKMTKWLEEIDIVENYKEWVFYGPICHLHKWAHSFCASMHKTSENSVQAETKDGDRMMWACEHRVQSLAGELLTIDICWVKELVFFKVSFWGDSISL